jgi:hypothetical protein
MAAKTAHTKSETKLTALETLIEFKYLLAYQMKANWLAFCINRLLSTIFVLLCYAISGSSVVIDFRTGVTAVDVFWLSESQIEVVFSHNIISYLEYFVLTVALCFTVSSLHLLLRLWNTTLKNVVDIHSGFEGSNTNKLSYFVITWAGPFSIALFGLEKLNEKQSGVTAHNSDFDSAIRITLIVVAFIYLPLGCLFSYVGFSDRRSANSITLRPLSRYMWLEQLSFTFAASSLFFTAFDFNMTEYIFLAHLLMSLYKWKELSMLPFSNTTVTQWCLIIAFCENSVLVVICVARLFVSSIAIVSYFSSSLIVMVLILVGKVGDNLGIKLLLHQLFDKNLSLNLSKVKLTVWILADVRLHLKQVKEQHLLLNGFCKDSFFFLFVSFFKRHKSECHLTNCICFGRKDGADGGVCVRPKKYANLKSMIKDLITLSLKGVVANMPKEVGIHAQYIYAHWLVHCERNLISGLVTIAQIKAQNPPIRIRLALEMLVREIRIIHESRQNNLSDEKFRQNSLVDLIQAQKEFDLISKNVHNFLQTFELLCAELMSSKIVFQEVQNLVVMLTKEEEELKDSMGRFNHNLKIQRFKQIFMREFALHFNYSLETSTNKLNLDIDPSTLINIPEQNFYLMVGAYSRDLNKIIDCSKNIDMLLGQSARALRQTDVSKIIPPPVSEHHETYIANYVIKAKSEIMDSVRFAFLVNSDGFLVSVKITIKNYFDYRNHRFLLFCHIKKKKPAHNVLCDGWGRIYGMTPQVAKIFAWNPSEDIGAAFIQKYVPHFAEVFDKNTLSKKMEPSFKQKLEEINRQLMHAHLAFFSLTSTKQSMDADKSTEEERRQRLERHSPAMQVIYQTLSRYCKYQPRRYKLKASMNYVSVNSKLFYVINFSKINPVQLSDIQIKSRWMMFLYRISIMKIFVKAWKLGHDVNVRNNFKKDDPCFRKASTFKEIVRPLPMTNRRVAVSSIMVSNQTLPKAESTEPRESIVKVKEYLPVEFTLVRLLFFFLVCLSLFYYGYTLNYTIQKASQTISLMDETISAETIFSPIIELMIAKQFKNDYKSEPGLSLANQIESEWFEKSQKVFEIFRLRPELISEAAFESASFIYNSTDDAFDRESQFNVFDTMTYTMHFLNRKTVSPRLVTKSSGMFETIRKQFSKNSAINPSMIMVDQLAALVEYNTIFFVVVVAVFSVLFFILALRLHNYRNMLIEFGTKIQFQGDVFRRIQKLRILLELGQNKFSIDNSDIKKNELAAITVYKTIPFPWVRVLSMSVISSVCLFWYAGYLIIPLQRFSQNLIQIIEIKKLITQNSFDMGIALHRILSPTSIMALDVDSFRERVYLQNSYLSNARSLTFWNEEIQRTFQSHLCSESPLRQYDFCTTVEEGLFNKCYVTASTYIMQRVPVWLKNMNADPPTSIFANMVMIRIATQWLTEIIKEMGLNVYSETIAVSAIGIVLAILSTVLMIWIFVSLFEKGTRANLRACFKLVRFLRTELILSNSRIKQFVYRANRSN